MKPELDLLTRFALNETEGPETEQVLTLLDANHSVRREVDEIRQVAQLIEKIFAADPLPVSRSGSTRSPWIIGSAVSAGAAVILMIVALPHITQRNGEQAISVEEDAFAESYSPGVDKEAVRQVVRSHLGELKSCYEDELKHQPSFAGKLLLRFSIASSGAVSEAFVKRSLKPSASFATCIVNQVRGWKFPPPGSDVKAVVEYPFVFDNR